MLLLLLLWCVCVGLSLSLCLCRFVGARSQGAAGDTVVSVQAAIAGRGDRKRPREDGVAAQHSSSSSVEHGTAAQQPRRTGQVGGVGAAVRGGADVELDYFGGLFGGTAVPSGSRWGGRKLKPAKKPKKAKQPKSKAQ